MMLEAPSFWSDFLFVLALVGLIGLFVATEFALLRANVTWFKGADGYNGLGARAASRLVEQLDLSLSTIQFGLTLASLVLGWWGERTFIEPLASLIGLVGIGSLLGAGGPHSYVLGLAVALSFVVVVMLLVSVTELLAKPIAMRYPETTLRCSAGFIVLLSRLFRPLRRAVRFVAGKIGRLTGLREESVEDKAHSLDELSELVSQSTDQGVLNEIEEEMVRGVFGLASTVAREVMTPRTDIVAIPVDSSFDAALRIVLESGRSRFPVKGKDVDDILGIVISRDLLRYVSIAGRVKESEFSIKKLMREPFFVPATKPADDLMAELKRRKMHMAIVLDEHGGVAGVVTLEDLIEEIVGEIFDESDLPDRAYIVQENGDVLIDAGELVVDVNRRLRLDVPEGDYDTIAGFIFTNLGRIPLPGDSVVVDRVPPADAELSADEDEKNLTISSVEFSPETAAKPRKALISVEKVDAHRIERVRFHAMPPNIETAPVPPDSASYDRGEQFTS